MPQRIIPVHFSSHLLKAHHEPSLAQDHGNAEISPFSGPFAGTVERRSQEIRSNGCSIIKSKKHRGKVLWKNR